MAGGLNGDNACFENRAAFLTMMSRGSSSPNVEGTGNRHNAILLGRPGCSWHGDSLRSWHGVSEMTMCYIYDTATRSAAIIEIPFVL